MFLPPNISGIGASYKSYELDVMDVIIELLPRLSTLQVRSV